MSQFSMIGRSCGRVAREARGFTLMEILIVLALIAVVLTLVVPQVMGQFAGGQAKATKAQISTVATAVDRFYLDNGAYPERLDDLVTKPGTAPNWAGPYVKPAQLKDPWGEPLQYKNPGDHGDYDLWSHGRDKRAGGDGNNADLNSWD